MRDLSPSPLDITNAKFASNATMLRKSSASPPATCTLFQLLPKSVESRITPFEPQALAAMCSVPSESTRPAALTPRKFVSILLVCTDHDTPPAAANAALSLATRHLGATPAASASTPTRLIPMINMRIRMPRILTTFYLLLSSEF
jgi:hypothetical protein